MDGIEPEFLYFDFDYGINGFVSFLWISMSKIINFLRSIPNTLNYFTGFQYLNSDLFVGQLPTLGDERWI